MKFEMLKLNISFKKNYGKTLNFCPSKGISPLNQLQQRNKWRQSKGLQLSVGNMVLLQENKSVPLKWNIE